MMCVFNEEKYIDDTIESILSQTFADFEFIIVEDASTDKTREVAAKHARRDRRIKLILNEHNVGIGRSRNKGIGQAKGKYIATVDCGDLSHPQRLEKQVKFLEQNDDIYIVGTWAYWMDKDKRIIGTDKMPSSINSRLLYSTGGTIHTSTMVRKELFERIGGYDTDYPNPNFVDFALYFAAMENGYGIANIPEFLVKAFVKRWGVSYRYRRQSQLYQFQMKLRHLPDFWSFWNVIYTMRSLAGYFLPDFLLLKFIDRRISRDKPSSESHPTF